MNKYRHVGQFLLALDIHAQCSPCVECIMPPNTDPAPIAERLTNGIHELFQPELPGCEWMFKPIVVEVNDRSGIIKSREEDEAAFDAACAPFQALDAAVQACIDTDPNNGKMGWWRVDGVRHNALVKTDSARKAVEKAKDIVQDWEAPTPTFLGEELPDVVEL